MIGKRVLHAFHKCKEHEENQTSERELSMCQRGIPCNREKRDPVKAICHK